MDEKWKILKYYIRNKEGKYIKYTNDLYEISSFGRIRNTKSKIIRKLTIDKRGYLYFVIKIRIKGKKKSLHIKIHRAVAFTFFKKIIQFKKQVNHKDGNKLNNMMDNLEWCSASKNVIHAYDTGLNKSRRYNKKEINKICECIETYELYKPREICNILNLKYEKHYKELINGIVNGRIYKSISINYDFVKAKSKKYMKI